MKFDVEVRPGGAFTVARVLGELDIATTPRLQEAVEGADAPDHLVVDLTEAAFIDSTACRYFVNQARAATKAGRAFSVVCPEDNYEVWRVLDILGLLEVLGVRARLEEA